MKKIVIFITVLYFSTSCVRDQNVNEDLKQIKDDLKALREDVNNLKSDGVKADSTAISNIEEKIKQTGEDLEGENDPANQGEFKELEKKK